MLRSLHISRLIAQILLVGLLTLVLACKKDSSGSAAPSGFFITHPANNTKIIGGRTLDIQISMHTEYSSGLKVIIYFDDQQIKSLDSIPYHASLSTEGFELGDHTLKAELLDGSDLLNTDQVFIRIVPYSTPGPLLDARDGNIYQTVEIGEQVWMKENLRYENHIHTWYVNNDNTNTSDYGLMYMTRLAAGEGLCPEDWHVPSREDWAILIDFLGGEKVAGGKLKERGTDRWEIPNFEATNESGFSARPAGSLTWDTIPEQFGKSARFFTSFYSTYIFLNFDSGEVITNIHHPRSEFYSIRCIRDY